MADPKSNTGTFGVPPGGPWFVFLATGTVQRQSNPALAEALALSGWIGFANSADAYAVAHGTSAPALVGGAVDAVSGATTDVGDFLSRLTSPQTWIRVAEVVLGLLLIAVGIAKLTNAIPAATKVAKTVGVAAAL